MLFGSHSLYSSYIGTRGVNLLPHTLYPLNGTFRRSATDSIPSENIDFCNFSFYCLKNDSIFEKAGCFCLNRNHDINRIREVVLFVIVITGHQGESMRNWKILFNKNKTSFFHEVNKHRMKKKHDVKPHHSSL